MKNRRLIKVLSISLIVIWSTITVALFANLFIEYPPLVKIILAALSLIFFILFLIYLYKLWKKHVKEDEEIKEIAIKAKVALKLMEKQQQRKQ